MILPFSLVDTLKLKNVQNEHYGMFGSTERYVRFGKF